MWPFSRRQKKSFGIGNAIAYGTRLADRYGASESGISVNEENSLRLLYVFSCIHVLSQTLAQIPLRLMKREKDGGSVVLGDNPLHHLVSLSPSEDMGSYVWRSTAEAHRQGWGNCFTKIVRDGPYIVALELMLPSETSIRMRPDRSIVYDYNPVDGPSETLSSLDVLHVPFISPDGRQGYSPIAIARDSIGLGMAIQSSGSSFFRNGATVKGVIESEYPPNALSNYAEAFRENFSGAQNANKTPILPKGMIYKAVSIPPDDAQTVETQKFNRTQICGMYRVPPSFIQDHERSTFTNAQHQDTSFVKYTIAPNATAWEQELTRKLLTKRQIGLGMYFRHDTDEISRGSTAERYAAYNVGLQGGWLMRNEVRRKENLSTMPGLDEPLVPTNMQPENRQNSDESGVSEEGIDNDSTPENAPESDSGAENGALGDSSTEDDEGVGN